MGPIGRSFRLVAQSYRILMRDKELMVLPLASGVIMAIAVISVAVGFGLDTSQLEERGPNVYLPLLLMYVATYAIGIFFQAAVVAGATERMRGGDPTVGSALAAAGRRIGPILMWAVVAGTVGLAIRIIHDRVGFVGKIITSVVGAAWSLATMFVVPVLVLEERPFNESFSRSVSVFKRTWGESVAGGVSLGAAAICAWLTLVAFVGMLTWAVGVAGLVVFFPGAIFLGIFFSALQGVYVASLFRYATEGEAPAGFDRALLDSAFVAKGRSTR
jgi:hypothetical protein